MKSTCFLFLSFFLVVTTSLSIAGPSPSLPTMNEDWMLKSSDIIKNLPDMNFLLPNAQSPSNEDKAIASEILQKSRKDAIREVVSTPDLNVADKEKTEIFLYITLGDPGSAERRSAEKYIKSMAGVENLTVIFRGLPSDCRGFGDAIKLVGHMLDGVKPKTNVQLDPMRFKNNGVDVSPMIMVEHNNTPIVWAKGVTSPEWILEKMEQGYTGDLGVRGEVTGLAERDMFDEIASRIDAVDWNEKKEQAKQRFWTSFKYVNLKTTDTPETFAITTQYIATKDIQGANGEYIVRKGEAIDIFDHINPTFYLVIFDASDERQIQKAVELGKRAEQSYRVKYIASRIPNPDKGWDEYSRISKILGHNLYLLYPDLAKNFNLQHVPSTVWAQDRQIIVQEHLVHY